mgnify:CR=1 FL=1
MKTIFAFTLGLIIGYIVAQLFQFEPKTITKTELIRDTITIVKPKEPIIAKEIIPKIIYRKDTVLITKPFEAKIDTIIKHDTILISYKFPENRFSYAFKPKPDTISQIIKINLQHNNCKCYSNWIIAGLGITAGIILSNFSK